MKTDLPEAEMMAAMDEIMEELLPPRKYLVDPQRAAHEGRNRGRSLGRSTHHAPESHSY